MDRLPTLPEGVSAWRPVIGHAFDVEPNSTAYPLVWESGLTDRLTLVWTPVPFEARYLLAQDDRQWLAASAAFLGSVKTREKNFDWRPSARLSARRRLEGALAIEGDLEAQFEIRRTGLGTGRTLGLRAGLCLEPPDGRLAFIPSIWAINESGETRVRYLGALPPSGQGAAAAGSRWRFPLALEVSYRLGRQWEAGLEAAYYRIAYDPGYVGLPVYLSVAHYW